MFFRTLGSLEASIGGRIISMGKNRQRTVLAILLLEVNRTVSVGRLVDAVWNGCPPNTAAEQIQTCIWQLRRCFAQVGADGLVETTAGGYALRVDEDKVDWCVLERKVNEARTAAANGDTATAVAMFRRALGMFRGPVLMEITSHSVQAAAAQWEHRQLTLLEECIDLELANGAGAELVNELRPLVRDNPLRERLSGQLMTALHSDDRRAEALTAYRDTRETMISQLGLEPGLRLQALHGRILAGEQVTPVAVPPPVVRVPAQLLVSPADFVGRATQAAEIGRLLTEHDGCAFAGQAKVLICTLIGRCGVGKTALALYGAHLVRDRFPDGQLYAGLGGTRPEPTGLGAVLYGFLHALGVPDGQIPIGTHERSSMYRSILANQRVLVVLDDVPDTARVRPLLPAGPGTAVLITSRGRLTDLPGASTVEVAELSEQDAVTLLTRILGTARAAAEPGAVGDIVRAAAYLPLGIRGAGARLAARPHLGLTDFGDRLRDPGRRLDELTHGAYDLRTSLAPSVLGLPPQARQLWLRLSLVGMPTVTARGAAFVGDLMSRQAEKLLDCLVDRGLVDVIGVSPSGLAQYRVPELICLYGSECASEELPESVRSRVLARAAAGALPPFWDDGAHYGRGA